MVAQWPRESTLIWCIYNSEQEQLVKLFPDAASIDGTTPLDIRQQLIADFKAGRRSVAEFWIEMGGRFIHIRYFPVRSPQGDYLGTLEVVQDAAGVRALTGERRLLDEG
jgi:hypothetical protein